MRRKIAPDMYLERKQDILNRCLRLTEDILSNLEKWESLRALFDKRMSVIEELQELENSVGDRITKVCTKDDAERLDDMLRLILNLDKRIGQSIQDTQSHLLDSMKLNTNEQKFIAYGVPGASSSGLLLDERQ